MSTENEKPRPLVEGALVQGRLIKRYKRFLADICLDTGEEVTAHCANPGSMKGLIPQGARVALSLNANPKAKLGYRWELVEIGDTWVGIHTGRTNAIAQTLIETGKIEGLSTYDEIRPEVTYDQNSRIDFLLSAKQVPNCYVEVKSVTLKEGKASLFPDSVTARGTKHLEALSRLIAKGERAVMLYIVQRDDTEGFKIAADIDPVYAAAYKKAMACGVEMRVHQIKWTLKGWIDAGPLPILA